jgi:dCMP deaminase
MISVEETIEMMHIEPRKKLERQEMSEKSQKEYMNLMNDTRPDWDTWFMTLAFVVSQRSLDKATKHGCVVVDGNSRAILSVGYNSPPRGCVDSNIPLNRPDKYLFMEHSESNAITNAARCGISLEGSVFYVTGPPCHDCFRKIINVGAIKLVQGPILHKRTEDQIAAIKVMNTKVSPNFSSTELQSVEVIEMSNIDLVQNTLLSTDAYISDKIKEQQGE